MSEVYVTLKLDNLKGKQFPVQNNKHVLSLKGRNEKSNPKKYKVEAMKKSHLKMVSQKGLIFFQLPFFRHLVHEIEPEIAIIKSSKD